ncbi:unnamed protein product [Musa acuminata subsp. malaccensis]|uniref:(wild Malaysian banana) hypothetical protein n=1 Tax=Musa acuminata subsp. malaccensis TaxID=214687 RepID=A0A804KRT4_MUSAM|nr:unnamed protein product [Musa acuminata subsp. malaccensis]
MLVGNKADLRHIRVVSIEEAQAFASKEKAFFMETSTLESINVENTFTEVLMQIYHKAFFMETSTLESINVEKAFTEVLTQIYHVVSKKVLAIGDDPSALPKDKPLT